VRQKQCGPLLPVELKNLALSNCALAANSVSIADTDCVSDSADWYFGHSVHGCEVMKRAVTVLLLFLHLFGNSYWANWDLQRRLVLDFVAKVSTKAIFLPRTPGD